LNDCSQVRGIESTVGGEGFVFVEEAKIKAQKKAETVILLVQGFWVDLLKFDRGCGAC
jgi:hypothetical protein